MKKRLLSAVLVLSLVGAVAPTFSVAAESSSSSSSTSSTSSEAASSSSTESSSKKKTHSEADKDKWGKPDSPVPLGQEKEITYKEYFGDQKVMTTIKLTVQEVLKGKEAQDKLLEFEDSNQDDIDKLDSKYEYHLIKVKLVYEKGDEDYPLDTIEMFPRVLNLKGKQIEQEVFPSIPKERMFLDYSLFPGAEHEGYIAIMVPKDGDYTISFNLSDPVFFSTTKE
ncbi:hypothetical protein MK526_09115 [Abiotrophia defectiva]|uniref:hypothetical protein n=1 Tax=Abiotrophia defectiva TaxID=46125 RepID=UPI002282ED7D|nr:hypothetical protein [Abiotrophia defectiva]MCY7225887.1 hypothetical protein [Abiotrophia defectiva]